MSKKDEKMSVSEATAAELTLPELSGNMREWDPELDLAGIELPKLDPVQGTGSQEFRAFVKQYNLSDYQERKLVKYLEKVKR